MFYTSLGSETFNGGTVLDSCMTSVTFLGTCVPQFARRFFGSSVASVHPAEVGSGDGA